jgi:energy-coupling factor transport system substrate-specific component
MGAGFLGIEPIFFLIVLGGLALGANYGFLLGSLAILVSALLTAGIGPWLPVQMLGAGLVGLGAGWLKKLNHWLWISSYCLFASYLYGLLVTLFTWPLLAGDTSLGFSPTASLGENVVSYLNFAIFSGGLLWDTGRALTTVVLVLTTKEALLTALNRAVDRASVDLTKLAARSQVTEVPLR